MVSSTVSFFLTDSRTCFIFRNPQPKDIKVNEVLGPFEIKVWYLMTGFFFLSVWCTSTVLRYENCEPFSVRISNSILIAIGSICQQSNYKSFTIFWCSLWSIFLIVVGTEFKMNLMSTRMVFICVMTSCFLFYNYYSSSIVSARLSEPIYKINDSLNELANLGLRVSSEYMVYFEFFLKVKSS